MTSLRLIALVSLGFVVAWPVFCTAEQAEGFKAVSSDFLFDGGSLMLEFKNGSGDQLYLLVVYPESHLLKEVDRGEERHQLFFLSKDKHLGDRRLLRQGSKGALRLSRQLDGKRNGRALTFTETISQLLQGERCVATWGADAVELLGKSKFEKVFPAEREKAKERTNRTDVD